MMDGDIIAMPEDSPEEMPDYVPLFFAAPPCGHPNCYIINYLVENYPGVQADCN
jgi:hypothetical protein